jgi:ribonuclease BN (tRNA processing enzyme)
MSDVRLTVVGSGDPFGSGGRFQTCLALETGGTRYLIDCGASSLIAMRRFGIDPVSVDGVLVSHLHGDHFGGIPFLILDAQFRRRTHDLRVFGPPGIRERVAATMEDLFPGSSTVERRFATTFTEFGDRQVLLVDRLEVTPYQVVHASGAPPFALRIVVGEKTIAYSGDTQWTESLPEVARRADVFVCEAYAFDKTMKYHLDFRTLTAHRGELTCRRLVLTHMSDDMLSRLPDLDVESATDGMSIVL